MPENISTIDLTTFENRLTSERRIAMYYQVVAQCAESLRSLETCFEKAEQHAAQKKVDVGVLLNWRLALDMQPLIYQVQSACDYVKAAAAWLSGQQPPKHEDNEQTVDELRNRIRKTLDFATNIPESQYANASTRLVSVSWAPHGKVIAGRDYLLQITIPNVYFHIAMAYAILRNGGVNVGKMDFLGHMNFIDGQRPS
jgi:uncharacterized protein